MTKEELKKKARSVFRSFDNAELEKACNIHSITGTRSQRLKALHKKYSRTMDRFEKLLEPSLLGPKPWALNESLENEISPMEFYDAFNFCYVKCVAEFKKRGFRSSEMLDRNSVAAANKLMETAWKPCHKTRDTSWFKKDECKDEILEISRQLLNTGKAVTADRDLANLYSLFGLLVYVDFKENSLMAKSVEPRAYKVFCIEQRNCSDKRF